MTIKLWSTFAAIMLLISFSASSVLGADEKEDPKEKSPPKKSKIAWESVKSASGKVESTRPRATNGRVYGAEKPVYVEFTIASPAAFRIKFKLEGTEDRGGKLKVALEKEEERGKSKDWKGKGNLPARVGQEGEQVFTLGPGNYRLELTGEKTKYEFNVEEAVKATE
ncbi:MAG: hypothetical protein WD768_17395 [Phycisphaeraceae bacterium]